MQSGPLQRSPPSASSRWTEMPPTIESGYDLGDVRLCFVEQAKGKQKEEVYGASGIVRAAGEDSS